MEQRSQIEAGAEAALSHAYMTLPSTEPPSANPPLAAADHASPGKAPEKAPESTAKESEHRTAHGVENGSQKDLPAGAQDTDELPPWRTFLPILAALYCAMLLVALVRR